MSKINVGSKNPAKVEAVREVLESYDFLKPFEMNYFDVFSGVREQPIGIEEIVLGAKNRAKNSFMNCNYSVGIENGLMPFPEVKSKYMNTCICAIHDGKNYSFGQSLAYELPSSVIKLVFEKGMTLDEAFHAAGLTEKPRIGYEEGIISILTKGKITRKDYTKQAVQTALIHLLNPELYK